MKYSAYAFQYTKDTTLRWFQYRISHRILATNEYLFKLKLKDSKLCRFCNIKHESVIHLFVAEERWGFTINNRCDVATFANYD